MKSVKDVGRIKKEEVDLHNDLHNVLWEWCYFWMGLGIFGHTGR